MVRDPLKVQSKRVPRTLKPCKHGNPHRIVARLSKADFLTCWFCLFGAFRVMAKLISLGPSWVTELGHPLTGSSRARASRRTFLRRARQDASGLAAQLWQGKRSPPMDFSLRKQGHWDQGFLKLPSWPAAPRRLCARRAHPIKQVHYKVRYSNSPLPGVSMAL